MSKLRKTKNNKLILVLPMVLVISFVVLLTYSFANFKSIKLFDAVGGFFLGNEYTLSYDVANCNNKTIKNGKTFGELCEPATPDGYTFDGWYYNDELIEATSSVHTNQNIQLLAHFSRANNCTAGYTYEFAYTGDVQDFTAQCPGQYKVELWGAQGGYGNGASYTAGDIELDTNEKLYFYVGNQGSLNSTTTSYNGGGGVSNVAENTISGSGGGATDVRYFGNTTPSSSDLEWNSVLGLNSRIMVASGSSGGVNWINYGNDIAYGAAGGGLKGYDGSLVTAKGYSASNYGSIPKGATQTAGGTAASGAQYANGIAGKFGIGGTTLTYRNNSPGAAGGFYGGGSSGEGGYSITVASSGSSYISGYLGSIAIAEGSLTDPRTIKSGCNASSRSIACSTHYSNKIFINPIMIDGKGCNWETGSAANCGANQPQPDGTVAVGHSGTGYARATYLGDYKEFAYTGNYQEYTAPRDGIYQVELWGAKGGTGYNATAAGGAGGYTSGKIYLNENEKLYIYVGQYDTTGNSDKTIFNNGAGNRGGWNGGGATDVRYFSSTPTSTQLQWNNFDGIKSRIMVAGGGGTKNGTGTAGAAGGLIGYSGGGTSGGTQTTFGAKQQSDYTNSSFGIANGGCSGGNGYYPGGGATCVNGSGGGSSFISGYNGCNAISSTSTSSSIVHTNQPNHYSGKVFIDGIMIDGKGCDWSTGAAANCGANQPQPDGTNAVGHNDAGYARITYIGNSANFVINYNYNSAKQYYEFTAPYTSDYQIELWGAQGGIGYNNAAVGALGGYTSGKLNLTKGEKIYIYVGQHDNTGSINVTVFNNGTSNIDGYNGGGATDVRYFGNTTPTSYQLQWNNFDGLKSRIMVAGAGGTMRDSGTAGAGGGLTGYNGGGTSGGTQTAYGSVQDSRYTASSFGIANGGCTGGNGYYPGGGATCVNGSGGGSSFISGYNGCNAISSSSTSSNIIHTGQPNHYSGKVFTNVVMIDGKGCDWSTGVATNCGANQPQPDGTYAIGHSGNGFARITY